MQDTIKKIEAESKAKQAVVQVIRDETVDTSLRTVARVRAKLKAYEQIEGNLDNFMIAQAEALGGRETKEILSPGYKLAISRLIFQWLDYAKAFIDENEDLLSGIETNVNKHFIERALEPFPEEVRERLLAKVDEKMQEMARWFGQEIRAARDEMGK